LQARRAGGGLRHQPVVVPEHHQRAVGVVPFVGIIQRERRRKRQRGDCEHQNQMIDVEARHGFSFSSQYRNRRASSSFFRAG